MAKVTYYTDEEKAAALGLVKDGLSLREVSQKTGISIGTLSKWSHDQKVVTNKNHVGTINKSLLALAGDNDLSQYVGREITTMTVREIVTFLRLLGVKGKLTIEQTIKV